jgi:hypothetical protein
MSRLLDDAQQQYLELLSAVVTGVPLTIACWMNPDDDSISQTLMSITDNSSDVHYFEMRLLPSSHGSYPSKVIAMTRSNLGYSYAATTANYSTNTWHHACAVFAAANSRTVYLDGGNEGSDSGNYTPTGLDRTAIGVLDRDSICNYMSGRIAEAAIWDAALTKPEVQILAAGYSPLFVRPQALKAYWPLIRESYAENEDIDLIGGYDLVDYNGPSDGAHPRVLCPGPAILGGLPASVGPVSAIRRAIEKY